MPCKLVLGPANSAKAGEVLGAYGAVAPRGALLVVPTGEDARHYRRELAAAGVVFGSVVTFSGLAREIAQRTGYAGVRVSDLQRDRLLRDVLAGLEFVALGRSAAAPGFRLAAGDLIAECQRELVTPQRLIVALRAWAASDARRARFAAELGAIYAGYVRALDRRGRVDRELYAWRALDSLRAAPQAWGRDEVFFYGFDELTSLERDAVETLSRIAGTQVTVSLTFEAGRNAMASRAHATAELSALADEVLELPASDEHYAPGSRIALHALERGLFEPGRERIDPGPAITLLESGGERAEAELVAGQVLGLLAEGIPGEQIVVVARSLRRAAPLLTRVFAQYGIALAGRHPVAIAHTPLGRALRGAVRCALLPREARPADLLDYLRAPGLLERPELADRLEAEVAREGIGTATAARARLGWNLTELDALAGAADPAAELAALARRLFAAPHRGLAPALSADEQLDAAVMSTLVGAVQELAALGARVDGAELLELLDELTVTAGSNAGEVLLAEPLTIRARRFAAVIVCGMQEGELPAPARPDPFLTPERRRELAESSGLILRGTDDALERERYLFYTTVSRATDRVLLSYRSSDEEGNVALVSPFIEDVAELLVEQWPERRLRRPLSDVVWDQGQAPTERERARAQAAAGAPPAGEQPAAERTLGEAALARLRHTEILSAGALETYADCPVKWLVERELRPAELEPESEPVARGNLMHAALDRVLTRLDGPLTPASLGTAQGLLDQVLEELVAMDDGEGAASRLAIGRPAVVREAALRAIEADLRRYLEHEAHSGEGWRPFGLELRFGFSAEDGSLPPLSLGDNGHRVLIRGAIDRIDVAPDGAAVVRDYKSGAPRPDYPVARWSVDRKLQVALYMLVVRELTELEPAGGFYQPLRGDSLRPRGMFLADSGIGDGAVARDGREREEFEAVLEDASARAIALAAGLRGGVLTPCPQTCSRDGCAFPGICRSQ